MEPWTTKYAPKKSSEIKGQEKALKELESFLSNYKKQTRKAALLHGPIGTGKTSIVHAIANEKGYELLEINASDFRSKNMVEQVVGQSSKQQSLFFKPKLILFDEIDGLSGTKDRGGVAALAKIIDKTSHPIIMTANDAWDRKLKPVRNNSLLIELQPLEPGDIAEILGSICKKEKIKYQPEALKTLARRTSGDARSAINDAQIIAQREGEIKKEKLDLLGERKKTEKVTDALLKIFKTTDPLVAMQALDNIEENMDEFMLWLDENLPKEYEKPEDVAKAYDRLSKADVYRGRIRRQQYWRFLVYMRALLSAGIATSKKEKYKKMIEYKATTRIFKLWRAKQSNAKKKEIASKMAKATHTSQKQAFKEMPYYQQMFKNDKDFREQLIEEIDLGKEEVAWLNKQKSLNKK